VDKQEENTRQYHAMCANLKSLRKKHNWSIAELSQRSGIEMVTLADIEIEKDFEINVLFTLCRVYGVKVHEIFTSYF